MSDLPELLDHYFSLGVAEGKEGRDHDTETGEAQATRDLIDEKIQRLKREIADTRSHAQKLTEALEPIKTGIDASVWHFVQGERMKRVLVAETAIARITNALRQGRKEAGE